MTPKQTITKEIATANLDVDTGDPQTTLLQEAVEEIICLGAVEEVICLEAAEETIYHMEVAVEDTMTITEAVIVVTITLTEGRVLTTMVMVEVAVVIIRTIIRGRNRAEGAKIRIMDMTTADRHIKARTMTDVHPQVEEAPMITSTDLTRQIQTNTEVITLQEISYGIFSVFIKPSKIL